MDAVLAAIQWRADAVRDHMLNRPNAHLARGAHAVPQWRREVGEYALALHARGINITGACA